VWEPFDPVSQPDRLYSRTWAAFVAAWQLYEACEGGVGRRKRSGDTSAAPFDPAPARINGIVAAAAAVAAELHMLRSRASRLRCRDRHPCRPYPPP